MTNSQWISLWLILQLTACLVEMFSSLWNYGVCHALMMALLWDLLVLFKLCNNLGLKLSYLLGYYMLWYYYVVLFCYHLLYGYYE